jgi:radical S-adenosyl methionine domain-containing protein 2
MFIQPCNFRCSYCFAVFDDLHGQYLNKQQNLQLCHLLSQKFKKITFLGGEPTLIPYLKEMLIIAKSYHATTSIITNGYRLNDENYLKEFVGLLDWITVSIDSANPEVHAALGRGFGPRKKTSTAAPAVEDPEKQVKPLTNEHYFEVARLIKKYGFKFKISTVVNQFNKDEGPSSPCLSVPRSHVFLSPSFPRYIDMSKSFAHSLPVAGNSFNVSI